jgi:hypothetical protein
MNPLITMSLLEVQAALYSGSQKQEHLHIDTTRNWLTYTSSPAQSGAKSRNKVRMVQWTVLWRCRWWCSKRNQSRYV